MNSVVSYMFRPSIVTNFEGKLFEVCMTYKVKIIYKVEFKKKIACLWTDFHQTHIYSLHCLSGFPAEFHKNPTSKSVADAT